MNSPEDSKDSRESRMFSVQSPTELQKLLTSLQGIGNIKGVGFDVFGTVTTSLYSRREQSLLLAQIVADYYRGQTGKQLSTEQCFTYYNSCRDNIRNSRKFLNISNVEISQKQQECPEAEVIAAIGQIFELNNIPDLIAHVEEEWLQFDLENTHPIQGMFDVVGKTIEMYGREHVGLYSNNSCSSKHLISLLEHCGYLGKDMIDHMNVLISNEFGIQEYGIGLRKPNSLAFNGFARRLGLEPGKIAFAGDGGNDVLFALDSGGVGIRIS